MKRKKHYTYVLHPFSPLDKNKKEYKIFLGFLKIFDETKKMT
jgi:hypothetical protein